LFDSKTNSYSHGCLSTFVYRWSFAF
jgi:hypothetical protein